MTEQENIGYLLHGEEVIIVRELNPGFLIRRRYGFPGYEDDEIEFSETTEYAEHVFTSAPIEKVSDEYTEIQEKIAQAEIQLAEIQSKVRQEGSLISRSSKITPLKMILDFIEGNFQFIMDMNDLNVRTRGETCLTNDIGFGRRNGIYKFGKFSYGGDLIPHEIFNSVEDMVNRQLEWMRENCQRIEKDPGISTYSVKNFFQSIRNSNILSMPEVVTMKEKLLSIATIKESERNENNLLKQKQEIEEKLQQIKKTTQPTS